MKRKDFEYVNYIKKVINHLDKLLQGLRQEIPINFPKDFSKEKMEKYLINEESITLYYHVLEYDQIENDQQIAVPFTFADYNLLNNYSFSTLDAIKKTLSKKKWELLIKEQIEELSSKIIRLTETNSDTRFIDKENTKFVKALDNILQKIHNKRLEIVTIEMGHVAIIVKETHEDIYKNKKGKDYISLPKFCNGIFPRIKPIIEPDIIGWSATNLYRLAKKK